MLGFSSLRSERDETKITSTLTNRYSSQTDYISYFSAVSLLIHEQIVVVIALTGHDIYH